MVSNHTNGIITSFCNICDRIPSCKHTFLCSPRHLLASGGVGEVDDIGQAKEHEQNHERDEGPRLLKYLLISFGETSHGLILCEILEIENLRLVHAAGVAPQGVLRGGDFL